jgi:hypothetical protein
MGDIFAALTYRWDHRETIPLRFTPDNPTISKR